MGFFDSSSEQKTKSSLTVPDWMKGMPEDMANQVMSLMGRTPPAPGERVAPWSDNLTSGVNSLAGFGAGDNTDEVLEAAGLAGVQGLQAGRGILADTAAKGPAVNAGLDMSKVGGMINNELLDSSITAALRDPTRQFTEQTMPGSRMAQAASGNTGSTRAAIGDAVLQRGFEDRSADVGAMMRGNAYNTALGIEGQRVSQNAGLEQQDMGLDASIGSSSAQTGVSGANMANMAHALGLSDIQSGITAGQMETAQNQALMDVGYSNWLMPMQQLSWGSGILNPMASEYGVKKSVTTQDESPSPFSQILGAGSAVMGAMGGGGGAPNTGEGIDMGVPWGGGGSSMFSMIPSM